MKTISITFKRPVNGFIGKSIVSAVVDKGHVVCAFYKNTMLTCIELSINNKKEDESSKNILDFIKNRASEDCLTREFISIH